MNILEAISKFIYLICFAIAVIQMKIMTILTLIAALLLVGCSETPTANDPPQMANPASVKCIDDGGTLTMETDTDGGQRGICTLKDGTVCDEWAYFRGECPAQQKACTEEAKLCPDGSAVGRTGPNCEFSPCPAE